MVDHFGLSPLLPYAWVHRLDHGGGLLFNAYTHFLAQTQFVTGATAQRATGRTDRVVDRVPVGPALHDFLLWAPVDPDQTASIDWRPNDADFAATALTELRMPDGRGLDALFRVSAFSRARYPGYLAAYGATGTLHLDAQPWFDRLVHLDESGDEHSIPVDAPQDQIQAGWNRLVAEFAADIDHDGSPDYPDFHDGLLANRLIDQIRRADPIDAAR